MQFYIFGKTDAPRIILIHGVLCPWQVLREHAELLAEKHCVIVPALDGHDGTDEEFVSTEQQAEKIENYCIEHFGSDVFAVCGQSMGGVITHHIWANGRLRCRHVIMDGAPLVPAGAIPTAVMTHSYIDILRGSKARRKRTLENFKKHFLPERFLPDYLAFIDHMSEKSLRSLLRSVFHSRLRTDIHSDARVLFIHGTAANELLAVKSAKLIKKHYPDAAVIRFDGAAHCEMALSDPNGWCGIIMDFCENNG